MLSGEAIATLVVFILSIIFVIHPVSIPIRFPRQLGPQTLPINLTTAPIIAIAILWASQCLGPEQIRNGIVGTDGVKPYNILILFFSLAYMAITLDITGVLKSAAFWVSNKGGSHGYRLYFYFYVMLTALSVFLGNDPVILSGTAFLVYYTKTNELNPTSWLMSEFAAANTASMVLFVGNPTNVVICEGFAVNNAAFTAYTILPFLACIIACLIALAVQFRDGRYIPKHLHRTEKLDVLSVLLDPISAWVGSILLGSCLIVIIVVSFFHVDVWKISLPFAVAKFVFDIFWDYYGPDRFKLKEDPLAPPPPPPQPPKRKRSASVEMVNLNAKSLDDLSPLHTAGREEILNSQAKATAPQLRGNRSTSAQLIGPDTTPLTPEPTGETPSHTSKFKTLSARQHSWIINKQHQLKHHFPTLITAFPRLPFALVPFAFSQFILIEGLAHQGWIEIFSNWLVRAANRQVYPTIWLVGVLGVILCNISGTNIGATILLTKVVRGAKYDAHGDRAAAIALAVASNIGAVSFTFSASLAGLLWRDILKQKGINIQQRTFAYWNALPLLAMTAVGLGVVCAEMAVLANNG